MRRYNYLILYDNSTLPPVAARAAEAAYADSFRVPRQKLPGDGAIDAAENSIEPRAHASA
jgi:hypothetical protein